MENTERKHTGLPVDPGHRAPSKGDEASEISTRKGKGNEGQLEIDGCAANPVKLEKGRVLSDDRLLNDIAPRSITASSPGDNSQISAHDTCEGTVSPMRIPNQDKHLYDRWYEV